MGMETLKMLSNAALDNVKTNLSIIKAGARAYADSGLVRMAENGALSATAKGKAVGVEVGANGRLVKDITDKQRAKSLILNDDGSRSNLKIAGAAALGVAGAGSTYMSVSAAGRILSGGGLYRDSEGNFDIIGVPFI